MHYDRSDIKITFEGKPSFVINKSKKTIYCTLTAKLNVPNPIADENELCHGVVPVIYGKTFKAKEKVVCSKEDVFDIEKGKHLVLAKAENKIYGRVSNYLKSIQKPVSDVYNAIENFQKDAKEYCKHNEIFIKALSTKLRDIQTEDLVIG